MASCVFDAPAVRIARRSSAVFFVFFPHFLRSRAAYAEAVLFFNLLLSGNSLNFKFFAYGSCVIFSPKFVANAVLPSIKNGASMLIFAAIF